MPDDELAGLRAELRQLGAKILTLEEEWKRHESRPVREALDKLQAKYDDLEKLVAAKGPGKPAEPPPAPGVKKDERSWLEKFGEEG